MAKRARTERRTAAREAEKLAHRRERLAAIEPGGSPDRPIDVTTASVIEPQARSLACLRCADPGTRVLEHEARELDGRRLRVVRIACPKCGAQRVIYFRIVETN